MKKNILKSKNFVAKIVLTILGFTLAASQALAQYMVIIPTTSIHGTLKGVNDTLSKFVVLFNNRDTFHISWKQKYQFTYIVEADYKFEFDPVDIKISEQGNPNKAKYQDAHKVIAIKPDEEYGLKEVEIELKKKD